MGLLCQSQPALQVMQEEPALAKSLAMCCLMRPELELASASSDRYPRAQLRASQATWKGGLALHAEDTPSLFGPPAYCTHPGPLAGEFRKAQRLCGGLMSKKGPGAAEGPGVWLSRGRMASPQTLTSPPLSSPQQRPPRHWRGRRASRPRRTGLGRNHLSAACTWVGWADLAACCSPWPPHQAGLRQLARLLGREAPL